MNKSELYKKLQNADPKMLKELKISEEELKYIKEKLLNDKLGLTINFTEVDNEEKSNYILLEEEKELAINAKEKNNHLLIEGDNYHALKALLKTNIKVDVIYIDPPYNTGKEFVYKDDFGVDKVVGSDDPHKHSKWLSFMKKRLELAKELLSEEGVIFVSIDDNEQAYLKVLMDEIFGEENFVGSFSRNIASGGKNNGRMIAKEHDYVVCYSFTEEFSGIAVDENNFKLDDGDGRGKYQLRSLVAAPGAFERTGSQTNIVELNGNIYRPTKANGESWYWRWGSERIELGKKLGLIVEKNNELFTKLYLEYDFKQGDKELIRKERTKLVSSRAWNDVIYSNGQGSKDLKQLGIDFSFPKPVSLVKSLLLLSVDKNSIVLDFFAGSGTTGQAVLELNQHDGGNRRFILITNNEMTHEKRDENLIKKNGDTFYNDGSHKNVQVNTLDFPEYGIARAITRERLFRVINGEGSQGEKIEWKYSDTQKSLKNNSVKYLKTKLLNKIEGEFEEIDAVKELYANEFDKEISITDFKE